MLIVLVEIENFRGIRAMSWAPRPGINCLIGPGDSTKTTILDAIELALNPRRNYFGDDYDFYGLDVDSNISLTISLGDLPTEFKAETRYGLHLRGWSPAESRLYDEPSEGLEDVLSIRVTMDQSLEARWSLFNQRIAAARDDPPMIRYNDLKLVATTRLGPYAEHHLAWGRHSVLNRLEESRENVNLSLAEAGRAARSAFRERGQEVFKTTAARVQELSKEFSVPVKSKYRADLDIQSLSVNAGGIALHDGDLPLRRLGAGSSRLLVSALQHDAAVQPHIALIDEVEHGLEPHRIARLLKFLGSPERRAAPTSTGQIIMTTHSPVVIRELAACDIHTVRSDKGVTIVKSIATASRELNKTQAHLRSSPEAFLARRILIGEGKTECGLARGLDAWWTERGKPSFAFQGVVAIHGDGKDSAPQVAETLLELGYAIALLLDSNKQPSPGTLRSIAEKGGKVVQWEGGCCTEERIFLDLPWDAVVRLVHVAVEFSGADAVLAHINDARSGKSLSRLADLRLPPSADDEKFRRALGSAANEGKWFKDIARAEAMAAVLAEHLQAIPQAPLTTGITAVRCWIDAS